MLFLVEVCVFDRNRFRLELQNAADHIRMSGKNAIRVFPLMSLSGGLECHV
jgi:hypothetical protein